MDARIGQLMRNGKIVHYAFLIGFDRPAVEGSQEEIEIALGLRVISSKPARPVCDKSYIVHIEKKYPAWDEKGGFNVPVDAPNAKEAIKRVRKHAADNWISGSTEGPVYYRARLNKLN